MAFDRSAFRATADGFVFLVASGDRLEVLGALVEAARNVIDRALGFAGEPERVRILRQRRGIPQYVLGHVPRLG